MMLDDIQIYRVHMAIAAIAPLPADAHPWSTLRVEDWSIGRFYPLHLVCNI